MAEYIEREAVYRAFSTDEALSGYEKAYCREIIKKIPSADVAPVRHGEWILGHVEPGYFTPGGNRPWICSKCKQVVSWSLARPEYNYCHNCGANMDGGKDGV